MPPATEKALAQGAGERGQTNATHHHEAFLKRTYGDRLQMNRREAAMLQARIEQGGLWHKLFHAAHDRGELDGFTRTIENAQWRIREIDEAFRQEQQAAREDFEARQRVEREDVEARLEHEAMQRGAPSRPIDLPDQQPRHEAAHEATGPPPPEPTSEQDIRDMLKATVRRLNAQERNRPHEREHGMER